jgi:hypothetical protein
MFFTGLTFGIGFFVGMSGTVAIVIGFVALAEWLMRWWTSKSEQARKRMTERTEFRKQMTERAEPAITRHEKMLVLLRYPSLVDEKPESACRRSVYIR